MKKINIDKTSFVVLDEADEMLNMGFQEDIEFILSKYEDEDEERIFNELAAELSSGNVNFLDANIYLLGQDIYRMLQDKTLIELNKLLEKMIKKFDYAEERSFGYMLKVLQKGIYSLSPKT